MKSIEEILANYKDYATDLDDRFGRRFCDFLTIEQMASIGFSYTDKEAEKKHVPKEWTEENIIKQLKEDLDFGWEKCCDQRGISASLMADVVQTWCNVLENGLYDLAYGYYGDNVFKTVAKKYDVTLPDYS